MYKLLLMFGVIFPLTSYGQSLEFYLSSCSNQQECKNCPPDSKIVYLVNKTNQTVIFSETDLLTNKTTSRSMENCSIIDDKNFICGKEKQLTRKDGVIVNLDSRTIIRDGRLEDNPHIKFMDQNGNLSTPPTPKKLCVFKKNIFGRYEVSN